MPTVQAGFGPELGRATTNQATQTPPLEALHCRVGVQSARPLVWNLDLSKASYALDVIEQNLSVDLRVFFAEFLHIRGKVLFSAPRGHWQYRHRSLSNSERTAAAGKGLLFNCIGGCRGQHICMKRSEYMTYQCPSSHACSNNCSSCGALAWPRVGRLKPSSRYTVRLWLADVAEDANEGSISRDLGAAWLFHVISRLWPFGGHSLCTQAKKPQKQRILDYWWALRRANNIARVAGSTLLLRGARQDAFTRMNNPKSHAC